MKTLRLGTRLGLLLATMAWAVAVRGATWQVEVVHRFGGAPLKLGECVHTDAAGDVLSVTRLDYLLSRFAWVAADGREVVLPEHVAYVSTGAGRTLFTLRDVPAGRFSGFRFRVGPTPDQNHRDPASIPAGDALNPTVNGLHWGWQGGFVSMALEGRWREADGTLGGYSYHLAAGALVIEVEVPLRADGGADRDLRLTLDVAKIFAAPHPIRIADGAGSTHSRIGDPLAVKLGENVARAFRADLVATAAPVDPAAAPGTRVVAAGATPYRLKVSRTFPRPSLPTDNPLTEEGVALGRRLFHDTSLSVNGTQSCASCHQATAAFTDPGRRSSVGAEGTAGTRNTMPLANLAWQTSFFWDGRTSSLREQVLMPVTNPVEMHESLAHVVRKLERAAQGPVFASAFGTPDITADRVARALEQYLLTLTSHGAKFDQVLAGTAVFDAQEQRGFELFHTEHDPRRGLAGADCFHCHGGPLFSDFAFHNNGLDAEGDAKDLGRRLATRDRADTAKFKTPSLRDVALTAPYMHDGRFATLEEAVAHYCSGVHRSGTLDPNLAKHPDGGIALGAADQAALVAFLRTLTDLGRSTGPASVARVSTNVWF